jgi:hypothetical protein
VSLSKLFEVKFSDGHCHLKLTPTLRLVTALLGLASLRRDGALSLEFGEKGVAE